MIEHRVKTPSTARSRVFGLTTCCLLGSLVLPPWSLPTAAQANAGDNALTTVPIEIRFDLMNPCIEDRRQDTSMAMSADVFVDGHLDRSVTNHHGTGRAQLQLTAGAHEIAVTAPGYSEDKKTIQVRDNAAQKFAFHVRSGSRIAVEVIRTHNPDKAHRWMKKLRRKGQPATVRTVSPTGDHEPELLVVQVGPLPTCDAAARKVELIEDTFDRDAYIVPLVP